MLKTKTRESQSKNKEAEENLILIGLVKNNNWGENGDNL